MQPLELFKNTREIFFFNSYPVIRDLKPQEGEVNEEGITNAPKGQKVIALWPNA